MSERPSLSPSSVKDMMGDHSRLFIRMIIAPYDAADDQHIIATYPISTPFTLKPCA
jgi:hypothetical protein